MGHRHVRRRDPTKRRVTQSACKVSRITVSPRPKRPVSAAVAQKPIALTATKTLSPVALRTGCRPLRRFDGQDGHARIIARNVPGAPVQVLCRCCATHQNVLRQTID